MGRASTGLTTIRVHPETAIISEVLPEPTLSMKWRGVSETQTDPLKATLKDELDERRTLMRRFVPAATQAINDRATEEFRQAGIALNALKIGDKAPEFTLPDVNNKPVSSADLLSRGPLIVVFIRGRWCPFCCATMESWQGTLDRVKHAGATLIAVAPMSSQQC